MPGPNSCPISPDFDFLDATLNLERLPVAELAELRNLAGADTCGAPGHPCPHGED